MTRVTRYSPNGNGAITLVYWRRGPSSCESAAPHGLGGNTGVEVAELARLHGEVHRLTHKESED